MVSVRQRIPEMRRLGHLLIAAAIAFGAAADEPWTKTHSWVGVQGATAVAIAISNPLRAYAFAASGSLLISDDGGVTWQSRKILPHGGIEAITIAPNDENDIYLSTVGDGYGLYHSTDGGRTIQSVGDGMFRDSAPVVAIDPTVRATLYGSIGSICSFGSCTAPGIAKSTDGGLTWLPTARKDSTSGGLAIDPLDPMVIYAIGYDYPSLRTGGIYRTTDGGITWPSLFPGMTSLHFLGVDAQSRVYVIADAGFQTPLLRSADRGLTWTRLATPIDARLTSVAVDPRRSTVLYASSSVSGVFASVDDGSTWTSIGLSDAGLVLRLALSRDGVLLAATTTGIYRYETPPPPPTRRRSVRSDVNAPKR